MPVTRHFLGWDAPIAEKVRGFLLPDEWEGSADLDDTLIVVPTRQAGRRLKEALARFCDARNGGLLSLRVEEPAFFFQPAEGTAAPVPLVRAVWADVLLQANPAACRCLFPVPPPRRDWNWALQNGELIQRLRMTLSEAGLTIASAVQTHGGDLDELDRWNDVARLEKIYLARLADLELGDPCAGRIARSAAPNLPPGIRRLVVAAVVDPAPLMVHALTTLQDDLSIDVLVHAPQDLADAFDGWGRPRPGVWDARLIDIPEADTAIRLCGTPAAQARRALQRIAEHADPFGPGDVAIGVPDRSVIPFVETALAECGLSAFDPADKPLNEHPLCGLVEGYADLALTGTYAAFAALLRHPDMLDHLTDEHGLDSTALLTELDAFQNTYLPDRFDAVRARFPGGRHRGEAALGPLAQLRGAVACVAAWLDTFAEEDLVDHLRRLLQSVYRTRVLHLHDADDQEFGAAADQVADLLADVTRVPAAALAVPHADLLRLLVRCLRDRTYHREREDAVVDLEGWLELPWNDAPYLVVTGMNEGSVPDSRLSDVFLPDTLRTRLGLRDDATRLARDAFLMTALIESRRGTGACTFIAGKTGNVGDPLKPSRLLFRCADEVLPLRAEALFGPVPEARPSEPSRVSFRLDAAAPDGLPPADRPVEYVSVTAFRDYLACPFRFYLRRVLRMEEADDRKRGLDAADFGSMLHAVLEILGSDADLAACDDAPRVAGVLGERAARWVRQRYGRDPALPITITLDAARQRLTAAARVHADLVRDGWRIVATERKIRHELGGLVVAGIVDRIDRHERTGRLRILDYKTSDRNQAPREVHFGAAAHDADDYANVVVKGRAKRWVDLQLPLYCELLTAEGAVGEDCEVGYFNLPKAVADTGVSVWDDLTAPLRAGARDCAEEIVRRIRGARFWPPAEHVLYDDFARLFHLGAAESVKELTPKP